MRIAGGSVATQSQSRRYDLKHRLELGEFMDVSDVLSNPELTQIAKLAPIVSASGLLASLCIALWQLRRTRKMQQRLKAQDLWSTYIQKAIEHPILAYPPGHRHLYDYEKQRIRGDRREGENGDRARFERYEWFVSYLLKTAREVLSEFRHDKYWRRTIERNLNYHADYLVYRSKKRIKYDFIKLSGRDVNRIIDRITKRRWRDTAVKGLSRIVRRVWSKGLSLGSLSRGTSNAQIE